MNKLFLKSFRSVNRLLSCFQDCTSCSYVIKCKKQPSSLLSSCDFELMTWWETKATMSYRRTLTIWLKLFKPIELLQFYSYWMCSSEFACLTSPIFIVLDIQVLLQSLALGLALIFIEAHWVPYDRSKIWLRRGQQGKNRAWKVQGQSTQQSNRSQKACKG